MNLTKPGSRTVKPVICCAKTAQQPPAFPAAASGVRAIG